MDEYRPASKVSLESNESPPARYLTPSQIPMIDEALSTLGEYGELRLIVEKGRLHFLVTHKSFVVRATQQTA